jgi:hypothetical protein
MKNLCDDYQLRELVGGPLHHQILALPNEDLVVIPLGLQKGFRGVVAIYKERDGILVFQGYVPRKLRIKPI